MTLTKIDLSNSDKEFQGRSSYQEEKFSKVFKALCFSMNPKKIVEFGLLDGYSLDCFLDSTGEDCLIEAYDLFDDFPYNAADFGSISEKYSGIHSERLKISKGNIFDALDIIKYKDIDIFHVDVANDGEIYEFCISNLLPLLRKDGILILEGGSEERDNCEWMIKYNKPKIREVLFKYQDNLEIKVFSEFPSMTLIKYK
jgi:predicted O-methyltransferase YrrM